MTGLVGLEDEAGDEEPVDMTAVWVTDVLLDAIGAGRLTLAGVRGGDWIVERLVAWSEQALCDE